MVWFERVGPSNEQIATRFSNARRKTVVIPDVALAASRTTIRCHIDQLAEAGRGMIPEEARSRTVDDASVETQRDH